MIESENNIKLPEIFSEEFFRKSLQNGIQANDIEIDNIKISLASAVGENYTSTIYRAEIKYRQENKNTENISLIVKIMIPDIAELDEIEAFGKEVKMYTEIVPKIEKLDNSIGTFAPKCFHIADQPPYKVIVLQDLKTIGYTMADRVQGLDEAHSKLVLQKLGRFHARTMVLFKQEPGIFAAFDKGFFQAASYDMPIFQLVFLKSLIQSIGIVSSWNGFEEIARKLKNVEKNFRQKVFDCLDSKPNEIRVLNHSDLWTNNMMFKYENGEVCEMKFIDLQVSTNGSPGCDINYFLSTSVQFDVLKTKREELLKCYYDSFQKELKEFNYPNIPTLEAVLNEVRGKEFFGFMVAISNKPIMMMDRNDSADSTLETMLNEDALSAKRAIVYSSPRYQEYLKYSLKRFNELGIFD